MASQFPSPEEHASSLITQLTPLTLSEQTEFNNTNTSRDTTTIIQNLNINIDRLTTAAPEGSEHTTELEGNIIELDESSNRSVYSVISTMLAEIFGFGPRHIQSPSVVGEPTSFRVDDSNSLPLDTFIDPAPGPSFEPAVTISDIPAHDSFSCSSLPSIITERYTRSLLDSQCTAGYPLYEPRPDSRPLTEYWKKGVRIGDVGVVTEDGIFDFLFNVCPSQNPYINPSKLPDDFEALECPDIRVMERHFKSQTHLFNKAINRTQEPDPRYQCLGPEGAILELPVGATLFEAKDKLSFKDLASRYAETWYMYTIITKRRDVPNGSLYLVTSCIKCTHWGIAVFDRPSASQDYLKFFENDGPNTPDPKYDWNGSGAFVAKVPVESDIPESEDGDCSNQCVFLRGYKIMLRKDVWDKAVGSHSAGTLYTTTSSSSRNSKQTPQADQNNQDDYPYYELEDRGGSEAGGGSSRRAAENTSDSSGKKPMDANTLVTTSSQIRQKRVIIQADFKASPLHPSDLINSVLLNQEPDARVALTHDDDWWNLLHHHQELAKIASSYTSVINEYGCASLELIGDRSSRGKSTDISISSIAPASRQPIHHHHFHVEHQDFGWGLV